MAWADICDRCQTEEHRVHLTRCRRCNFLGCGHVRKNRLCRPRTEECEERERDRVKREWKKQLRVDGFCVTPNGRIDGHGKYIKLLDNDAGEFVCAFCEKPLGDTGKKKR